MPEPSKLVASRRGTPTAAHLVRARQYSEPLPMVVDIRWRNNGVAHQPLPSTASKPPSEPQIVQLAIVSVLSLTLNTDNNRRGLRRSNRNITSRGDL